MTRSRVLRIQFLPQSAVAGGSILVAIGLFLVLAFTGVFELALLVLGGLLALAGLVGAIITAAKRMGARAWVTSLVLSLIGAALLIHEFVPAGDIIHASATIAAFGLGGYQIYHGLRERQRTGPTP